LNAKRYHKIAGELTRLKDEIFRLTPAPPNRRRRCLLCWRMHLESEMTYVQKYRRFQCTKPSEWCQGTPNATR